MLHSSDWSPPPSLQAKHLSPKLRMFPGKTFSVNWFSRTLHSIPVMDGVRHDKIFSSPSLPYWRSSQNVGFVISETAINDFVLTSFPLELPPALLVDETGRHRAEQDSCCQETNGGHDAGHYRPRQSTFLHHLRRREEVCGVRREESGALQLGSGVAFSGGRRQMNSWMEEREWRKKCQTSSLLTRLVICHCWRLKLMSTFISRGWYLPWDYHADVSWKKSMLSFARTHCAVIKLVFNYMRDWIRFV